MGPVMMLPILSPFIPGPDIGAGGVEGSWFDEHCGALRRFVSQGEINLQVGEWMSCRHDVMVRARFASGLGANMGKGRTHGMTTDSG
jgi:hypothetical protein